MRLDDMASQACEEVRQTDQASLERCKRFLKRRYELLWNEALWRGSIYRHDFTFTPGPNFSPQPPFTNFWCQPGGMQALPSSVDRVLALRRTDAGVRIEAQEALYRTSLDEYEEEGEAVKFAILPPACIDVSGSLTLDELQAEGVSVISDASDANAVLRLRYMDTNGEEGLEEVTLAGPAQQLSIYPHIILSATKPETDEAVELQFDTDVWFSIGAGETAAKRYPRIRLLPKPSADSTDFKALVKKKASPLEDDADEPELTGCENTLIALAQVNLLRHARQYGKSQLVAQEALALLQQFKQMEVVQQATRCVVTPDDGESWGSSYEMSKGWYL